MKKYLSHILTMALIAPALVSCSERVEEVSPESLKHTVSFSTADEPATKTGLAIEGSTIVPNWKQTSKDDVHLFEIDATSKTMGTTTAIQPSSDNLTARFKAEFSNAPGTYTYGAVVAKMNADNAFHIPAEQHPDAETLKDPAAEFLVGYSRFEYTAPTGDDDFFVDLFFDRVAALSRIGFTEFKGTNEKVLWVKIKSETSMTGSAKIGDITFGNPSEVVFTQDAAPSLLTIDYGEGVSVASGEPFYAYFVSVPGKYIITGIEIKTDQYLYTKTLSTEITFSVSELKNLKLSSTTIPVETVSLNKTELALNVGASETLSATVLPDLASNKNVTWSSSAPTVASVDANGMVRALAAGEAVITATTVDGEKTANCTVTVSDVYEYSLEIIANKNEINVNEELAYTAKLTTKKNGSVIGDPETLDSGVTWSSSSPAIAEINTNTGLAKGKAGGTTNITASYEPEHAVEPVTATVQLTVKDVISHSLEITPTSESINVGGTQAFTAIYKTITNDEVTNEETVTSTASWTSSKESVATVASGTATGVGSGETTIKATYEGISSNEATLTVNDVITYSLAINEGDKEINVSGTQAYTATLTTVKNGGTDYVQTTTAPVTPTISSDDTAVATVSGNTATGVKSGTANISASYVIDDKTVNTTTSVKLTVKDVYEYSLAIIEGDKEINVGGTQDYTATLTTVKNPGTANAVTTTATVTPTISSDDITVATVSGNTATGIKSGTANISASYVVDGKTVNTTVAVALTVKDVITYAVTISPTSEDLPRVIIGNELTFTLTLITTTNGESDEGTIVTTNASWASSDENVATVANGVVTGVAEGTAHITATYKDANNEDHSFDVLIAVTKDPNHAGDPIPIGEGESL